MYVGWAVGEDDGWWLNGDTCIGNSLDNVIIVDNLSYESHLSDLSKDEFEALFAFGQGITQQTYSR